MNREFYLDNPRIDTIAQYLKRRFRYRVGVVTTAGVDDATSAAHMGERDAALDVVFQFHANPFLDGKPVVDVWMGGGRDSFDPDVRADGRGPPEPPRTRARFGPPPSAT